MKATKEDVSFLTNVHDNMIFASKKVTTEQERNNLVIRANRLKYIQVDVVENDADSDFQKILKAIIEFNKIK